MATSIYFSSDDLIGYQAPDYHRQQNIPVTAIATNPSYPVIQVRSSALSPVCLPPSYISDCPSMQQQPMATLHDSDIRLLSPALSSSSSSSYCVEQDGYLTSSSSPSSMSQPSLLLFLPPYPPLEVITTSGSQPHQQEYPPAHYYYYSGGSSSSSSNNNNNSDSTNASSNPSCFYWENLDVDPSSSVGDFMNIERSMETSEDCQQQQRCGPKIHYCPVCPHTSNRANNMKEHILTHDPSRPRKFSCPRCGKRFARKHDMKRHAKSPHHL